MDLALGWNDVSKTILQTTLKYLTYRPNLSSLIAVPIASYFLAYNALPDDEPKNDDKKDDDDDHHHFFDFHAPSFNRYWKARLIAFSVWIALMFLVFVPMHIWKRKVSTPCISECTMSYMFNRVKLP